MINETIMGDPVMADTIEPTLFERIGKAEWGATKAQTAKEHGASMKKSVEITAEYFEQDGPQQLNGLYIAGTETVICHTGTSPNSPEIAAKLTELWNDQDATLSQAAQTRVFEHCVEALDEAHEQLSLLAKEPDNNWWVKKVKAALTAAKTYLGEKL